MTDLAELGFAIPFARRLKMPELPEVETVRRGLLARLSGKTIAKAEVLRPASIGYPEPDQFALAIVGHTFVDVRRRGKYLICELDKGAHLAAHLRMSGRLLVTKSGKSNAREEHIRVDLTLTNGEHLIFEDMRVFGRLWYIAAKEKVEDKVSGLKGLGPEPLDPGFDGAYLQQAFASKSQAVKSALLDQTIIAGIGNIYADESLHLAGVNPQKPAKELKLAELNLLAKQVIEVLSRAIKLGGSSLRNYTDSDGVNGNYQQKAHVYGREGDPCRRCRSQIVRVKIGGRSSHFCPTCQPLRKARVSKK